jgi:hypothetical protein
MSETAQVSLPVPIDRLREEIGGFGPAFLLTVTDDARPHAVAVAPQWDGDRLRAGAGRTSRANAAVRPEVTLLWPGAGPGEFSLIVDATATVDDAAETVTLVPTRAVLHRPAPGGTGSDCVDLAKTQPA